MICKKIIQIIEKEFPLTCAMEWDNVGLLAGRDDKEVKKIYVALDATDEIIKSAIDCGADMLVTHHPLIFGSIKKVSNQNFIGNRLVQLIQNDISYYAMHTNYDVKKMGNLAVRTMNLSDGEVLEITGENESGIAEGVGRIVDLGQKMTLQECCELVKQSFSLQNVQVFGDLNQSIHRLAICPGSGKSVIGIALAKNADVLVTGDIGHHEGIDAVAQGLAVIDAGHYGIEHIFVKDMGDFFREHLQEIDVEEAPNMHPFCII